MKKKLIPIMLSVIFILSSFMTITAFAASPASQDGLTATLTSSKTTYASNEDIDLSLTVTNNNAYAVDGIQTKITLPDGVTAKAGSLTQNTFTLAAGESKTSTPTIIKAVTITPPKDDNNTSPKTGDSSNIAIWLIIMLISGGALVFLAIKNKKIKSKGVLSLFLCFAILGTIGLPISANAASTQKSFTVTEDLTLDGKAVTVSAEISYNSVTSEKDTYSVTVNNGTVQGGVTTVAWGETVTVVANTPQADNHFTGWAVVSGGITLADSTQTTTTFTMPKANVEVTANEQICTAIKQAQQDLITAQTELNHYKPVYDAIVPEYNRLKAEFEKAVYALVNDDGSDPQVTRDLQNELSTAQTDFDTFRATPSQIQDVTQGDLIEIVQPTAVKKVSAAQAALDTARFEHEHQGK